MACRGRLNATAPDKPFFVYYVPGGTHSPHQPTKEWIDKFKGKFDLGWNRDARPDPGADPRAVLPGVLVPVQPLNKVNYTWSIYYNFDQYLWSPQGHPDQGIGMFFRFGASDGVANPIKYAYNVGFGGKEAVPGRSNDTFGLGWARTQLSDTTLRSRSGSPPLWTCRSSIRPSRRLSTGLASSRM